jgi:hypothetical protein
VNYCSNACQAKAYEIKVDSACVICGAAMLVRPNELGRVTTCSDACASERKSRANARRSALTEGDIALIRTDDRLHREIADAYGISRSHVSSIKCGCARKGTA